MCFDICTINVRVSIRVCGLHFVFSQQRKLGVFSHSKGPGAGRSSEIRTAQGWEPGSQEGASFSKRLPSKGSQVSGNRFPGTGSQARFPRGSFPQARFPGRGSQARFPSKVPRNRFPSKVHRQGSQEQDPKQGLLPRNHTCQTTKKPKATARKAKQLRSRENKSHQSRKSRKSQKS